jgi:PAS domain S-box-containing protein
MEIFSLCLCVFVVNNLYIIFLTKMADTSSSFDIKESDLRASLNRIVSVQLRPVSKGLAVLFVIFAIAHILVLSKAVAITMSIVASSTAVFLFCLSIIIGRRMISSSLAHPVGALIAALILINSLLHLYLVYEPRQTTNLMLLNIGVGCFFLSTGWLALVLSVSVAGWFVIASTAPFSPAWLHFGFALFASVILSVLVHQARIRIFRRLESLRLRDRSRKSELEAALSLADQSRQAARESEKKYRDLFEHSPIGIYRSTPDGRILMANPALIKMLGYSSFEEFASCDLENRSPATYSRRDFKELLEQKGEVKNLESIWLMKDGVPRIISENVNLFRGEDDRILYYEGTVEDITERKHMDRALKASEAYNKSIIDNMLGGLITTDQDGFIESVNRAAEKIFGYAREELIGKHLKILMPEYSAGDAEGFLRAAFPKAIGQVTEWEGRRKSGEVFPFELLLFDFYTFEGRRFAGSIRDVSERREVERLKKEFVSTVSHELRTPLTSIRGSLSLLAGGVLGDLPEEAGEVVAIAERNTVRLINLINDILDLERLESGKLEMHFEDVEVESILSRSVDAVRSFALEQGIALEVSRTEARVYADGDRLVQVLVNLISNAVKFSPRESVVEVRVEEISGKVEFRVKDRGRGIPMSHLDLIFERFRQVESTDSRKKGGTGLGLAICKAIIDEHEGEIGVESEEGKGSTFWFRVPSSVSRSMAVQGPAVVAPACDGDPDKLQHIKTNFEKNGYVLLVDDDQALLDVMLRQLTQEGINVYTAGNGRDAILMAQKKPPALLVLDVGLPEGDGFDVVEALQQKPDLNKIPLLVYTCRELTIEQQSRLKLGTTRFLTKSKATDEEFRTLVVDLLHSGDK